MAGENVEKLIEQGKVALREGRRDEAQEFLIRATEIEERNADAWLWLASAVDDEEDQRLCVENVLQLEPDNAQAQQMLAELDRSGGAVSFDLDTDFTNQPPVSAPSLDDPFGDTFGDDDFMTEGSSSGGFSTDTPFSSTPYDIPQQQQEDDDDVRGILDDDADDDIADDELEVESTPSPVSPGYEPIPGEAPTDYNDLLGDDDALDAPAETVDDGFIDVGGSADDDDFDNFDTASDDPLDNLPRYIKPTRLPGTDEKVNVGLVIGIVIVAALNVAAVAALIVQLV
jgi:hypothetical protein